MPINSRNKGQRGEREVRDILNAFGYKARRGGQQSGGGNVLSADVHVEELQGILHFEVKFTETLNIHKAFEQSTSDSEGALPVVVHRKLKKPWLITLDFKEFLKRFGHVLHQMPQEKAPKKQTAV